MARGSAGPFGSNPMGLLILIFLAYAIFTGAVRSPVGAILRQPDSPAAWTAFIAFVIAIGPQLLCGRSQGNSGCSSYWVDVAKCSTITVPLGAVLGLARLLPDRWSEQRAPPNPRMKLPGGTT